MFVAKYDKDGNFMLDLDEINAIQDGAMDQFANYDHLTLDDESKKELPKAEHIKKIKITRSQLNM